MENKKEFIIPGRKQKQKTNKGKETIRYCTLISLIRERYEEICNKIIEEENKYYIAKNIMFMTACATVLSMKDLEYVVPEKHHIDKNNRSCFHDLIVIYYDNKKISMPVPLIAKWLDIPEDDILDMFFDGICRRR